MLLEEGAPICANDLLIAFLDHYPPGGAFDPTDCQHHQHRSWSKHIPMLLKEGTTICANDLLIALLEHYPWMLPLTLLRVSIINSLVAVSTIQHPGTSSTNVT